MLLFNDIDRTFIAQYSLLYCNISMCVCGLVPYCYCLVVLFIIVYSINVHSLILINNDIIDVVLLLSRGYVLKGVAGSLLLVLNSIQCVHYCCDH